MILKSGNSSLACSFFTDGWTMTSSPTIKLASAPRDSHTKTVPGTQLIGVVTLCLSPVWRESTTRNTSAVLRPVEAGYERINRMVFFGSMTKTLRIVKAIPFWSTLVVSWWSIISYRYATFLSLSPMMGNLSVLPEISSMSLIHPEWLSIVFADSPISLTPRLVNSGSSFANAPSSVVQTGV